MRINVRLVGGLVHTLGFSERDLEVLPGTTAGDLLDRLGITPLRSVITTRNGTGIAPEEELAEGDRVLISPPFSGG